MAKQINDFTDLVGWIDDHKTKERRRNRPLMVDWINTLAAYHGRPDLKVADDLRLMPRLTPEQRRELESIKVNWVQPHIRTTAAHLQKARPMLNVEPQTTDEADLQSAKVGDRLIRAEWDMQEIPLRRIEKAIWMVALGTGIWHTYFDPARGEKNQGMPIGQIVTDTVSPFKVSFEPNRTDHTKCRWAILTERLPIDEVVARYGETYSRLNNGAELYLTGHREQELDMQGVELDSLLEVFGMNTADVGDDDEWTNVEVLYHLPTHQYPQGLYSIVCEGKVLYVGGYPYPFLERLPFCVFREVPAPWRFYGESSTAHVLHAQEHYVDLRLQERRYLRKYGNGKWLLPKGLRLNRKRLTSEKESFVPYTAKDPRHKPEFVAGQNPPGILSQSMERAKQEGAEASGMNEASQGVAPTGISAGRALLALQEMDATRLGLTVEAQEREYGRYGQNVLLIAKNFYTESRRLKIVGEAMEGGMFFFNAADLGASHDVVCQPGSAMPQNRVAKQEAILEFFPTGILGNPQDPETLVKVRRMLEFGQLEDVYDEDGLDEQKAEHENLAIIEAAAQLPAQLQQRGIDLNSMPVEQLESLAMQVAPPAAVLENHFVHSRNHVRQWKQKMVQGNMLAAKLIEAHLQHHYQFLQPPQAEQPAPGGAQPGTSVDLPPEEQPVATPPALERGDLEIQPSDMEPALRSALET